MAKNKKPNLYATLCVRPVYEPNNYFIWELILFDCKKLCVSVGHLIGYGRYKNIGEAQRKAEYYAELLNIQIDRKSIIG